MGLPTSYNVIPTEVTASETGTEIPTSSGTTITNTPTSITTWQSTQQLALLLFWLALGSFLLLFWFVFGVLAWTFTVVMVIVFYVAGLIVAACPNGAAVLKTISLYFPEATAHLANILSEGKHTARIGYHILTCNETWP
jgi:uncharacterized membrane protein